MLKVELVGHNRVGGRANPKGIRRDELRESFEHDMEIVDCDVQSHQSLQLGKRPVTLQLPGCKPPTKSSENFSRHSPLFGRSTAPLPEALEMVSLIQRQRRSTPAPDRPAEGLKS